MNATVVLMTAEEFALLPESTTPAELVKGRIAPMNRPAPRYGEICFRAGYLLGRFLEDHDLGRVVSNDSGVVTERNPDTVRGADVAYYSYARVPKGPLPRGYLPVAPDLVFEVRSPGDRWNEVHVKVGEYLKAGVTVVCVLDETDEKAHVFHADQAPRVLAAAEDLTLPGLLDAFREPVARFFA
jgi:Uma2 family endonuclease